MIMSIIRLSIVTAMGANTYEVGGYAGSKKIAEIKVVQIRSNGDQFEHYCGYDDKGQLLFTVDKLCPCDVLYS
jgi:hypothetical protein